MDVADVPEAKRQRQDLLQETAISGMQYVSLSEGDGRICADKSEAPSTFNASIEIEVDDVESDIAIQRIDEGVCFHPVDTTLNVLPGAFGGFLKPLCDGGFQYLLAGARANVGVTSGRYMFEVRIVENAQPAEDPQGRGRGPMPRHVLRAGFATSKSSLILGDGDESFGFDSEGSFIQNRSRSIACRKFGGHSVALVLNLDEKSANRNTLSLFVDGVRASAPQPVPGHLSGKPLYPLVTFKNVTLHVNFGPSSLVPLPFRCHMMQEASRDDAIVSVPPVVCHDGKAEVVFPICIPDEGGFEWLERFLQENTHFVELSDRMILDWAEKSGIWRPKGYSAVTSVDRPEMNFGLSFMDDLSIRRIMYLLPSIHRRNYVVMEVRGNLIKNERARSLSSFPAAEYVRTAKVLIGEPDMQHQRHIQALLLKRKQEPVDPDRPANQLLHKSFVQGKEPARSSGDSLTSEVPEQSLRNDDDSRTDVPHAELPHMETGMQAVGDHRQFSQQDREHPETLDAVANTRVDNENASTPVSCESFMTPHSVGAANVEFDTANDSALKGSGCDSSKAQFAADETMLCLRGTVPDLTQYQLSISLGNFSIPTQEEGFDSITYDWSNGSVTRVEEHFKAWVKQMKRTTRIEDIQPSQWFSDQLARWQGTLQGWRSRQTMGRHSSSTGAGGEHGESAQSAKADGSFIDGRPSESDFDELDVFSVEDVGDMGNGSPLFNNFQLEDWTMLSLRYEIHLLTHAVSRDAADLDRKGIHLDHLGFYYNRYFKKALHLEHFGVSSFAHLVGLLTDTLLVQSSIMESQLPDHMDSWGIFVKLTEEARRDRLRLLNLGEERARLNIKLPATVPPREQPHFQTKGQGKYDLSKGYYQGFPVPYPGGQYFGAVSSVKGPKGQYAYHNQWLGKGKGSHAYGAGGYGKKGSAKPFLYNPWRGK